MKRLKYIMLASVLTFAIGCQNTVVKPEVEPKAEIIAEDEETTDTKEQDELFAAKTPADRTNCYNMSEEDFFKLISYLIYLEDNEGMPDIMAYEIVYHFGETVDRNSISSNDYPMSLASHRMLTSDLNIFFKDVLQSDKKYDADYTSASEAGIICKDDGYSYAFNGVGWYDYVVIKNVNKKSDSIEIEADILNGIDDSTVDTIKFTLIAADNIFGYSVDK